MSADALPALPHVLGRDEHAFIDALFDLWEYCRVRSHYLSERYKVEEEELIFGDGRIFGLGYRLQLFVLAQAYFDAHVRRARIDKADNFYKELLNTMSSRARGLFSVPEFYGHCRAIYQVAREHGATERALRIKVNKVARVTHYFSAFKLWKDCTSPDPTVQWLFPTISVEPTVHWLKHHHFNRDGSDGHTDNDSTDNQSTVAQAGDD